MHIEAKEEYRARNLNTIAFLASPLFLGRWNKKAQGYSSNTVEEAQHDNTRVEIQAKK